MKGVEIKKVIKEDGTVVQCASMPGQRKDEPIEPKKLPEWAKDLMVRE